MDICRFGWDTVGAHATKRAAHTHDRAYGSIFSWKLMAGVMAPRACFRMWTSSELHPVTIQAPADEKAFEAWFASDVEQETDNTTLILGQVGSNP
jgi:hypothetical protein